MKALTSIVAGGIVFGVLPLTTRLSSVAAATLLVALGVLLALAASATPSALAVAAGALGAYGGGVLLDAAPAMQRAASRMKISDRIRLDGSCGGGRPNGAPGSGVGGSVRDWQGDAPVAFVSHAGCVPESPCGTIGRGHAARPRYGA